MNIGTMNTRPKRYAWIIAIIILSLVYIYKMRFGLHPDEAFSIVLMRANTPDHFVPFAQQYTVMQMAGWFMGVPIWIYESIRGNLDGVVIFLRLLWLLIQLVLAISIYNEFKKWWGELPAQLCSVISFVFYFNFFIPGYKSLLYWNSVAVLLCIMRYERTKKRVWVWAMALFFSICVLSYITSFVLIVPIVIRFAKRRDYKSICVFISTGLLCACVALAYTLSGSALEEVFYVLENSLGAVGQNAQSEMGNRGISGAAARLARALALVLASFVPVVFMKKIFIVRDVFYKWVAAYFCILLLLLCVLRPNSITVSRFYYAYLCFWGWAWIVTDRFDADNRDMVSFMYILSIWTIISISLGTMQGVAIIAPGSVMGIMATVICLTSKEKKSSGSLSLALVVALVFIIPYAFLVSDEDSVGNILSERGELDQGAVKGIMVEDDLFDSWDHLTDSVKRNTDCEDCILAVGKWSQIVYLVSDARMGGYSPVMFDSNIEQEYITKYPQRFPDIIYFHNDSQIDEAEINAWIDSSYTIIDAFDDWIVYEKQ